MTVKIIVCVKTNMDLQMVRIKNREAVTEAVPYRLGDLEKNALEAAVVLRDGVGVDAEELRAFCAARLASFKVPKAVHFTERLPRTESGKLLRRQLG